MHESDREHELAAWEARVSAFRPGPSRLDRDRVMYLAGRASVGGGQLQAARWPADWGWPSAFAGMTAIAAALVVALAVQRHDDVLPPPAVLDSVVQQEPDTAAPDRARDTEEHEDGKPVAVQTERVFWPSSGLPETIAIRSTRSERRDEVDRFFRQLAENRPFRHVTPWETEGPMSAASSDGPVQPRQPVSYVRHRRMLLQELMPSREISTEDPNGRLPKGA